MGARMQSIAENKRARKARKGSKNPFIGPEVMEISKSKKGAPKSSVLDQCFRATTQQSENGKTNIIYSLTADFLRPLRKQARIVTCLIRGHCCLRKHLHNMSISYRETPILCREEDETASYTVDSDYHRDPEPKRRTYPTKSIIKRLLKRSEKLKLDEITKLPCTKSTMRLRCKDNQSFSSIKWNDTHCSSFGRSKNTSYSKT